MIKDIVALKRDYGLLEEDFTIEDAVEWYGWDNPFIETIYEDGKLVGFCEWITARDIPKSIDDFPTEPQQGKVLIVGTLIATRPYVLQRLRDMVFDKNRDRIATVWHRKKNNRLIVIRRG